MLPAAAYCPHARPPLQVARKYLTDEHPESELSFLPVNRSNAAGLVDPNLFAFLCFRTHLAKVCVQGEGLSGAALCLARLRSTWLCCRMHLAEVCVQSRSCAWLMLYWVRMAVATYYQR